MVEETPTESSEDEMVAPSQVTASQGWNLELPVSSSPFPGPWVRSCQWGAFNQLNRTSPSCSGPGERLRWIPRHDQRRQLLRALLRLFLYRTLVTFTFVGSGYVWGSVLSFHLHEGYWIELRLSGSCQCLYPLSHLASPKR